MIQHPVRDYGRCTFAKQLIIPGIYTPNKYTHVEQVASPGTSYSCFCLLFGCLPRGRSLTFGSIIYLLSIYSGRSDIFLFRKTCRTCKMTLLAMCTYRRAVFLQLTCTLRRTTKSHQPLMENHRRGEKFHTVSAETPLTGGGVFSSCATTGWYI